MSRSCDVCGKGTISGNNVSHSHRKTKRKWKVNLVSIRALIDGTVQKIRLCTRCLRSNKVQKVVG